MDETTGKMNMMPSKIDNISEGESSFGDDSQNDSNDLQNSNNDLTLSPKRQKISKSQKKSIEKYLKRPRVYDKDYKKLLKGIYYGYLLDGKIHGEGKFVWHDGYAYQGNFTLGVMEGYGMYGHVDQSSTKVRKNAIDIQFFFIVDIFLIVQFNFKMLCRSQINRYYLEQSCPIREISQKIDLTGKALYFTWMVPSTMENSKMISSMVKARKFTSMIVNLER